MRDNLQLGCDPVGFIPSWGSLQSPTVEALGTEVHSSGPRCQAGVLSGEPDVANPTTTLVRY